MTKSDLRTGMVVETREGARYLVLAEDEYLIRSTSCMEYRTHSEDLTFSRCSGFDICKVYKPSMSSMQKMLDNPGTPIWERNHEPKVGDVYKASLNCHCVITWIAGSSVYVLWSDGSFGKREISKFKDYHMEFTGKTLAVVPDLLEELKSIS